MHETLVHFSFWRPTSTGFAPARLYNKKQVRLRRHFGKSGEPMTEEIYGDVLFLINFSMDFLPLYLAGKIVHLDLRAWRVILAASLGAAYGVVSLFFDLGFFWNTLVTVAVTVLMGALAFGPCSFGTFAAATALFAGIGMLIGGAMTAAFVRLGRYQTTIVLDGAIHTVYGDLPMWIFLVLAGLSALFTWGIGAIVSRRRHARFCEIMVLFDDSSTTLRGRIDSGNLVSEPITGTPVIFVKASAADCLPTELREAMTAGIAGLGEQTAGRLRVVPSRTVGGEAMLLAAVPRRLYLRTEKNWDAKRALIALDTIDGDFDGAPALVPEALT